MNPGKSRQAEAAERVIPGSPKPRVRDRIFQTARELFYRQGIRAVGVDTIANEAGTNKMSFYRSFTSKDELVAEYLRDQEKQGWEWWDEVIAVHAGNPRAQVEALFDAHVSRTCECDSRGCALANAAVEIPEEGHPAREVVEQYKAEMRRRFRSLAHQMGVREPDELGDSLMLLWEGSYLTRLTFSATNGPAQGAANAARMLIRAHSA
ncbi:TetR family transcriptional regulator [Panacagrimonas perspica]|uniref:TetR family transcriptional regulator n=1 Tax=Panacagrimonas perspica TaxID=381431 RepID=A0A4S3K4H6_9GAMM|nr:TetR family transcriptional regulator [Panacagrimonas perspica]THD02977.1 TetR family transcriptional regulator [Panacagrimonas perspica]